VGGGVDMTDEKDTQVEAYNEGLKEDFKEPELKDFVGLVTIRAYNEEDFKEQLDALDCYDLEWWKRLGR